MASHVRLCMSSAPLRPRRRGADVDVRRLRRLLGSELPLDRFAFSRLLVRPLLLRVRLLPRAARRWSPSVGRALGGFERMHLFAAIDHESLRRGQRFIVGDGDGDRKALFQLAQMRALLVEHVERDVRARARDEIMRGAACSTVPRARATPAAPATTPSGHGRSRRNTGISRSSFPARWCGCAAATFPAGRNARCGRPGCGRGPA